MEEAALRAGVGPAYVDRLVELGLVEVGDDGQVTEPTIRRLLLLHQLDLAGLPLEGLARLVAEGGLSFDFIEAAGTEAFAPFGDRTFAEESERTGIPVDVLMTIREATGGLATEPAGPDARRRAGDRPARGVPSRRGLPRARRSSARFASTVTASGAWPRPRASGGGARSRTACSRPARPRGTSRSTRA